MELWLKRLSAVTTKPRICRFHIFPLQDPFPDQWNTGFVGTIFLHLGNAIRLWVDWAWNLSFGQRLVWVSLLWTGSTCAWITDRGKWSWVWSNTGLTLIWHTTLSYVSTCSVHSRLGTQHCISNKHKTLTIRPKQPVQLLINRSRVQCPDA